MDRACRVCGEVKGLSDFSKNYSEGPLEPWNVRKICKMCSHKEYLSRYADEKKRTIQLAASTSWKKRNPERHAELARRYKERNPEKHVAQMRLAYAIRRGKIIRQPCEKCGSTERIHGHHESYDPKDWYNVRWLCFRCHKQEHDMPEYLKK